MIDLLLNLVVLILGGGLILVLLLFKLLFYLGLIYIGLYTLRAVKNRLLGIKPKRTVKRELVTGVTP